MTRNRSKFLALELKERGSVIFGNNSKDEIIGTGSIGMTPNLILENVLLVKDLEHNLLSKLTLQ